jgi:ABC-type transporter Mla maintaining outer membrane lipid asymmetry ATPase subunit MlaF
VSGSPVLDLTGVSKNYGGLRPLRIEHLTVAAGGCVSILGMDQPMAEVFVNLVTGASLPDAGSVDVFGRPTSAIADSAEWLALVDRVGIVSERAVLLEGMTAIQNLAVPFTLDIEPPPDEARTKAVALAREAGLPESSWNLPVASLRGAVRALLRVARALALDPAVLLLEHPTAAVEPAEAAAMGRRIRSVAERRGAAAVAVTADRVFADALGGRVVALQPASGRLVDAHASRWFGRR